MASIFRRDKGRKGKVWYIKYKPAGDARFIKESLRTTDKVIAQQKKREYEERYEDPRNRFIQTESLKVSELVERYKAWAATYYTYLDGSPTSQVGRIDAALTMVESLCGNLNVDEFGPQALREVRNEWIAENLARNTINAYQGIVRKLYRWGLAEGYVTDSAQRRLQALPVLSANRSQARETERRTGAPVDSMKAIEGILLRPVVAMMWIQYYTAARGGELGALKRGDIVTLGDVWEAIPSQHKNLHRGQSRTLYFGPHSQELLTPFLDRGRDEYLFNPLEGLRELRSGGEGRRPGQPETRRKTERKVKEFYTARAYWQAIVRACDEVGVTRFTPHQIRHARSQYLYDTYGAEAARDFLGHESLDATEIYTRAKKKLARMVALDAA